ncbi:MAG: hypothetical protein V8S98_10580 [Lachnospiraceae bacterium]
MIFMPTSVIYMVANFVIRPFLTRLTDMWNGRDYDCFKSELRRIRCHCRAYRSGSGGHGCFGKWVLSVMEMIWERI